ncbi:hypothetical protein HDV05_000092 [Chytridiales sp. JEL 0842]|nr:hypothetical protein HDV05_000092 [Chytridiales sp. JEL 0842]
MSGKCPACDGRVWVHSFAVKTKSGGCEDLGYEPEIGSGPLIPPSCPGCVKCPSCTDGKASSARRPIPQPPSKQQLSTPAPTPPPSQPGSAAHQLHTLNEDDESSSARSSAATKSNNLQINTKPHAPVVKSPLSASSSSDSPSSGETSAGTDHSSLVSPSTYSLGSSVGGGLDSASGDPSLKRGAGKAARKRRPESLLPVGAAHGASGSGSTGSASAAAVAGGSSSGSKPSNQNGVIMSPTGATAPKDALTDPTAIAAVGAATAVAAISISRIKGGNVAGTLAESVSGSFSSLHTNKVSSRRTMGSLSAGTGYESDDQLSDANDQMGDQGVGGIGVLSGRRTTAASLHRKRMTSASSEFSHSSSNNEDPLAPDSVGPSRFRMGSGTPGLDSSRPVSPAVGAPGPQGNRAGGVAMPSPVGARRVAGSMSALGNQGEHLGDGVGGFSATSMNALHSSNPRAMSQSGSLTSSAGRMGKSSDPQVSRKPSLAEGGTGVTDAGAAGTDIKSAGTGKPLPSPNTNGQTGVVGLSMSSSGNIHESHAALNISGGIGVRKGKGAQSSLSLHSSMTGTSLISGDISAAAANSTMDKSGESSKKQSPVSNLATVNDSSVILSAELEAEDYFPDLVDLPTLFGSRARATCVGNRLVWAARCYELAQQEWLKDPPSPTKPHSPVPNDEIKYRILENFNDAKLEAVNYSEMNGREYVSSGPAEALIDALIFPLNQDNSYAEVFLATYRFFLPASDVLTSLIEWYNVEVDEEATPQQELYLKKNRKFFRQRAIKVILTWVKNHWHDFHSDPSLLEELTLFVSDVSEISFGDSQKLTQAIREQRLSWYMSQYIPPFSTKRAPHSESAKPWGLMWEPEAFAEQLTLIDNHYFRQIRPDTYLHILQKPVARNEARNNAAFKVLMDYVRWFRLVSSYMATLILQEDPKKRGKAIKKFLKVAKVCRSLNNFNTLMAIVHALKRPAVAKLTSAWETLPSKYFDTFKEYSALADPADGYFKFWEEMKNAQAPSIPFFAAYIHDLVELNEEIPVYLSEVERTSAVKPPKELSREERRRTSPSQRSSSTSPTQNSPNETYKIVSTDDPHTSQELRRSSINFKKFYDLYSIIAELEMWRASSYKDLLPAAYAAAADAKTDTSAVVLNHMRDYPIIEDAVLDGTGAGEGVGSRQGSPTQGEVEPAISPNGKGMKRVSQMLMSGVAGLRHAAHISQRVSAARAAATLELEAVVGNPPAVWTPETPDSGALD